MKKDKRGAYWKKLSPAERSKRNSYASSCHWAKKNKEERTAIAVRLNAIRWDKYRKEKKLSTQ